MKKIKYIQTILLVVLVTLSCVSCSDEIEKNSTTTGAGNVQLSIGVAGAPVITPTTKSQASEADEVSNLNILVYDMDNGGSICDVSRYYDGTELTLTVNQPATYSLAITSGSKRICLIANAGDLRNDLTTSDALDNKYYDLDNQNPSKVMFADLGTMNISTTQTTLSGELVRIYSMVSVNVDTKGLDGVTVTPKSVTLKHVPSKGYLKSSNKIDGSDVACVVDGEKINFFSKPEKNVFSSQGVVFMYENMQGTNNYTELSAGDGTDKTPPSLGSIPTKNTDAVKKDRTCSYIEIDADYINNNTGGSGSGSIKYRFFLGNNSTDNFDVERNCHYKVTLKLSGKGGADEGSWRVEKDFKREFSVDDIFIGYRMNSKSDIEVKLPTEDSWFNGCLWTVTPNGKANEYFTLGGFDKNTNTVAVFAKKTNINSRNYNSGEVTITASKEGVEVSKTVKINQVIRLVDPIAFYKKWDNVEPVTVTVREFTKAEKKYKTLNSIGSWSVTIESGDWFTISKDGKSTSRGVNQITGTGGDIVFTYTPTSTTGSNRTNRYGSIRVKYHNERCEHVIYLRQGYADTKLLNSSDATWSLYNCIGNNQVTSSPTQSGFFFQGGSNSPCYNPWDVTYLNTHEEWKPKSPTEMREDRLKWDNNNVGPCPSGYIVPSSKYYSDIKTATESETLLAYGGYVYDDSCPIEDTPKGWKWNSLGNAEIEDNINCNPAKGTLLVRSDGDPINVFFSYGKSVLKHTGNELESSLAPEDTGIDEIGIGYLEGGKLLYNNENRYGAFYWSGSKDVSDTNMKFIDFWYSLNTNIPINVGTSNTNSGMFVRCIKKPH